MLVGEHEFQIPEHVVRTGRLVDVEAADIDPVPIDPGGVDLTAADIDAQVVALEHSRVPAAAAEPSTLLGEEGPDLLGLDRVRHVPIGIEHDLLHLLGDDRRLLVRLSHHHSRGVHGLAVTHHAHHEFGNVDVHIERAEVVGQPPPAFHVEQDESHS
jgi:hypothetical protein